MLKTKKEKLYLILIGIFVLATVCVLLISLLAKGRGENDAPAAPEPSSQVVIKEVDRFIEVEKKISSDVLQDGLNDMGVMITQQYYFTEVVSFSSVKKFLSTDIELKFTESNYLASYDGVVTAGIDFGDIRVDKNDETSRILLHIPSSQIHNVDIDPTSFRLFSEKTGLGNPLSAEDFNSSLIELEKTAKAKALERGILEQADDNARAVIGHFVAGLVDTAEYSVEYVFD